MSQGHYGTCDWNTTARVEGLMTLTGWLAAVASAHPSSEALRCGAESWTYDRLWDRSARIARAVARRTGGIPGANVGLVGQNTPELVAAYLGIMRAGAVVVPLNPRNDAEELRSQLDFVDAVGLIVADAVPALDEELRASGSAWDVREMDLAGGMPNYAPTPAAPAVCILTSGSTGSPKGVVHTQGTLLHAALEIAGAVPFSPRDVSLAFLPVFASAAEQIFPAMLRGAALHLMPRFDVDEVCQRCRDATSFTAVPTIIGRLLREGTLDDLRALSWIAFASEPMPQSVLEGWWQEVPGVDTFQYYGMTELLPITAATHGLMASCPSTVGMPFPTATVSILDADDQPKGVDEEGEVVCRSPARMQGYLRDDSATRAALTPSGAMRTGDLGRIDEQGRLHLTGRIKDVIISGGLNISPVEIESVACLHPGVATAAVVGIPDEEWGETPVVVVAPERGIDLSAQDLLAHCRNRLAGYKRPTAAAVVDEMPTIGIGKSAKASLRAQMLSGALPITRIERSDRRPLKPAGNTDGRTSHNTGGR